MIKTTIISLLLLASFNIVLGQVKKGTVFLGGNLSFKSRTVGDYDQLKYSQFEIKPNGGYFVINKLVTGLRLNIDHEKRPALSIASSSYAVAPFIRYYFLPAETKYNIFTDASFGLGKNRPDNKNFNLFAFSAGPVIFLTSSVGLEASINFQSYSGNYSGVPDERTSDLGFDIGFQIYLSPK